MWRRIIILRVPSRPACFEVRLAADAETLTVAQTEPPRAQQPVLRQADHQHLKDVTLLRRFETLLSLASGCSVGSRIRRVAPCPATTDPSTAVPADPFIPGFSKVTMRSASALISGRSKTYPHSSISCSMLSFSATTRLEGRSSHVGSLGVADTSRPSPGDDPNSAGVIRDLCLLSSSRLTRPACQRCQSL